MSPRGVDRDFLSAANQSCYRVNPLPCGKVHAFSKCVNPDFTGPLPRVFRASPGLTGLRGGVSDRAFAPPDRRPEPSAKQSASAGVVRAGVAMKIGFHLTPFWS